MLFLIYVSSIYDVLFDPLAPEDFDAAGRVVQFRREEPLVCTDIPVVADNATEGNESFVVRFVLPNITGIEAGLIRETVVTIVDISPPPQPPGIPLFCACTSFQFNYPRNGPHALFITTYLSSLQSGFSYIANH